MVRINDDYVIEIDAFNYTAKRDLHRTTKKTDIATGEVTEVPSYSTIGYYNGLTEAIKGVIKDMNRRELSKKTYSLEEAVKIVLENNKRVSELLQKALEI
jgi:hypothetical protein